MLSYIFTSKISQSHWLSLSFPFCQVYDYDWGLRDDFMGEASLPLGQLAPQKWNDLVLTLSETGEHFNSIQGWLWGMSFIPKPSRVCLSKTRQQNVKKLSFNNKGCPHFKKVQFFWTLFKRPFTPPPPFIWTFVLFCGGYFLNAFLSIKRIWNICSSPNLKCCINVGVREAPCKKSFGILASYWTPPKIK